MNRLIALLLIAGTAALAGCNTMAGAGQDISKGGNAITNSAEQAKKVCGNASTARRLTAPCHAGIPQPIAGNRGGLFLWPEP